MVWINKNKKYLQYKYWRKKIKKLVKKEQIQKYKWVKIKNLTEKADFSELCITSKAEVIYKDDIEIACTTKGSKCSICWKIKETACDRTNCAVKKAW